MILSNNYYGEKSRPLSETDFSRGYIFLKKDWE